MDPLIQLVIAVAIVVLTSATCSLFEAVLYALPLGYVESLAQSGRSFGPVLRKLRINVDRPIVAILSLNTIANTAGASIAGALAAEALGNQWLGYFSAVFTLCILAFSEVIPKTIGVVYSRQLAPAVAFPLQFLVWSLTPITWVLRLLTRAISRRQGAHGVSDEELITLVKIGIISGDLKSHEAEVIQNVLSLEHKTARDIMTPRTVVYSLNAQDLVGDASRDKRMLNYSRIPLYSNEPEDIVGIVHRRDVFATLAEERHDTPLERLMRPVDFVPESMSLDQLLKAFLERRQHLVAVIDEYGGLSGVATLEDVLEEILGKEIVDEFDQVADMRELAHRRRKRAQEGK